MQYAFNRKNSLSLSFEYEKSVPSSTSRSAAVVQINPWVSYTGNPALVPYNSFTFQGSYTFIPNKMLSFSTFGYAWIVGNRYVFDFEASSTGILRTVKQPMGKFVQGQCGVQGSVKLLNEKLQLSAAAYMMPAHNGKPYYWTKSNLIFIGSAYYYLDKVYLAADYTSPSGLGDGCMFGSWVNLRESYTFQVGWSNKNWNLRFFTRNPFIKRGYSMKNVLNSKYYDSVRYTYNGSSSGFFQISGTYTFGFGKKVGTDNEAYQATGASSGILK